MKRFRPFWFSLVSVGLVAISGIWAWVALRPVSGPLILHITKGDGITQIGTLRDLIGIWIFALLVLGINSLLIETLRERESFWSFILGAASFAFAALLFVAFGAIISLN